MTARLSHGRRQTTTREECAFLSSYTYTFLFPPQPLWLISTKHPWNRYSSSNTQYQYLCIIWSCITVCLCVQRHLSTQRSLTLSYWQPEQEAKLRWEPEFSLWIIFYLENNNPSLSILCRHGVPMRHQCDVVDVTWWSQSWRDMVTVTWSSALSELSASRSQPPAGGQVTLQLIRTRNDRSESLVEKSIIFADRDFISHFLFA